MAAATRILVALLALAVATAGEGHVAPARIEIRG